MRELARNMTQITKTSPFATGLEIALAYTSVGKLHRTIEIFSKAAKPGTDLARYIDGMRAGLYARIGEELSQK